MVIVHNSSVWWDMLLVAEDILFSRFLDKLDTFKCQDHVYWNKVLVFKKKNKHQNHNKTNKNHKPKLKSQPIKQNPKKNPSKKTPKPNPNLLGSWDVVFI